MKNHLIIQRICLLTSITCLGFPYILAGEWLIMPFFLAMVGFWIIMKKRSTFWSASILLSAFVLLAAIGMLANFSTFLVLVACTAALAWWDLTDFSQSIVVGQPPETTLLLERAHLQPLGLVISAGFILAFVSSYLNLRISFLGTVLLVVFTTGCLTYAVQSVVKKNICFLAITSITYGT
jgi:hypothetical protein